MIARDNFCFEVLVKLSYETLLRTSSLVHSHRGEPESPNQTSGYEMQRTFGLQPCPKNDVIYVNLEQKLLVADANGTMRKLKFLLNTGYGCQRPVHMQ